MKIMSSAVNRLKIIIRSGNHRSAGVIMIISLLIITGAFVISLSIASLVMVAISISRTQSDSVRAYFAADSGLERALSYDRGDEGTIDQRNCAGKLAYLCCFNQENSCLFFDQIVSGHEDDGLVSGCLPCSQVDPQYVNQVDGQSYRLIYRGVSSDNSQLYLESTGNSNGVKRSLRLIISRTAGCKPVCKDGDGNPYECGYNSCNGFCGQCQDGFRCQDFRCVVE